MSIKTDVLKLEQPARVQLWVLDLTALGGAIYRFCNQTNQFSQAVVWQGVTYQPFPIEGAGFEKSGRGPLPRPVVRVSDVTGTVGVLVRTHQGLAGAKVTRKQTLARYMDAANFVGGNAGADPNSYFPDEQYIVDRRSRDNGLVVEFELAASIDVAGVRLPGRQVIQNVCTWVYRSAECGYAGGAVADANDVPTGILGNDKCGKRLASCRLRFPNDLPFGGFPTAGLTRV